MPYDGNGTYAAPASSWNPAIDATDIDASDWISLLADVSTALSTCLLKDGTQTPTASIPMAGFKLTGLGAGSAAGNSLRYEQGVQSILTTIGDTLYASAANVAARFPPAATVAAHATTSNIWVAKEITLSGGAVTFTDIADAPYVGAVAWVKQNAAHIWTDGAVFNVQGGANYTAAADDWIRVYATTVSTFEVTIFKASGAITLATEQASTSGTSIDFTSIPSGTKRIKIMGVVVSTNGTSPFLLQLGDAGGPEDASYTGGVTITGNIGTVTANSAGFLLMDANVAASTYSFIVTLDLQNAAAFRWAVTSFCITSAGDIQHRIGSGNKALSAELDRVRITTANGTDAFDGAGVISISYS